MGIETVGIIPDKYKKSSYCHDIATLPFVNKLVLLPDTHIKDKYLREEYQCIVPSSCVIVSDSEHLYPQFRSRGIGCGMALWSLNTQYDIKPQETLLSFIKELFSSLINSQPILSRVDELIGRVFPSIPNLVSQGDFGIHRKLWRKALYGGAQFYLDTYLKNYTSTSIIDAFESNGNHLNSEQKEALIQNNYFLTESIGKGRDFSGGDYRSGLWISGNHFIELQKVTEIYDSDAAKNVNLNLGSLVIMNHSCGFGLEWILRPEIVKRRIKLNKFKHIDKSERDYDGIKLAVSLLKNLGSLRRAIFYKRLVDSARKHYPEIEVRLLAECNHNDIDWNSDKIIYRHNSLKIEKERYQIISGLYNHPSYLIQAGKSASKSCFTVGHGIGAFLKEKEYKPDPKRNVIRIGIEKTQNKWRKYFKDSKMKYKKVPYYQNDPGDELISSLEKEGIIKLIAKLSPLFSVNSNW